MILYNGVRASFIFYLVFYIALSPYRYWWNVSFHGYLHFFSTSELTLINDQQFLNFYFNYI